MNPYSNVAELEKVVAEYAGSKYAVAVDSCTNALLLCFKYLGAKEKTIELPSRTYVGVAYSILNAGGKCCFTDWDWRGAYVIDHHSWHCNVIDSARRFHKNMYIKNTLYCLSAHWGKHLKIGRGGFILTDDKNAADVLRIMRFDGRTQGVRPLDDNFVYPGHHCYMLPEEAARGLMLMSTMPDDNPDIPWDDYADLSTYPIFQEFI